MGILSVYPSNPARIFILSQPLGVRWGPVGDLFVNAQQIAEGGAAPTPSSQTLSYTFCPHHRLPFSHRPASTGPAPDLHISQHASEPRTGWHVGFPTRLPPRLAFCMFTLNMSVNFKLT